MSGLSVARERQRGAQSSRDCQADQVTVAVHHGLGNGYVREVIHRDQLVVFPPGR